MPRTLTRNILCLAASQAGSQHGGSGNKPFRQSSTGMKACVCQYMAHGIVANLAADEASLDNALLWLIYCLCNFLNVVFATDQPGTLQ